MSSMAARFSSTSPCLRFFLARIELSLRMALGYSAYCPFYLVHGLQREFAKAVGLARRDDAD